MRHFGTDAPEFFVFKIGDSEKLYKIPLAASMPMSDLMYMEEAVSDRERFKAQYEILKKYAGDVVDELPAGTISEILQAWLDESNGVGASVGESSASSELSEDTTAN